MLRKLLALLFIVSLGLFVVKVTDVVPDLSWWTVSAPLWGTPAIVSSLVVLLFSMIGAIAIGLIIVLIGLLLLFLAICAGLMIFVCIIAIGVEAVAPGTIKEEINSNKNNEPESVQP